MQKLRRGRQATTVSFHAHRADLADVRQEMRDGLAELRGKLDATAAGLEQITGRLNTLIADQGNE